MPASFFRERLPSAVVAIALQVGLFALLAMSFEVVRNVSEEKETILHLTPLPRPVPRRPVIMVGRGKPSPVPPPRAATAVSLPAWTTPGLALGNEQNRIQLAPRTAAPDCRTENYANLNPIDRKACLPARQANKDREQMPLYPDAHVKDEEHWAQEWEKEQSPYLPGVSAGPNSVHTTLFDSNGPSLLTGYRTPDAYPTHAHASDADVQKAMDAYHARMGVLYPRQTGAQQ